MFSSKSFFNGNILVLMSFYYEYCRYIIYFALESWFLQALYCQVPSQETFPAILQNSSTLASLSRNRVPFRSLCLLEFGNGVEVMFLFGDWSCLFYG
jgi:hypothetical protein